MTTIHRGLMNAATSTPTDPAARLRAIQQRIQTRQQTPQPGGALQPPPGLPPRNTGIIPPHMQQPRQVPPVATTPAPRMPASGAVAFGKPPIDAMPSTPAGMPSAQSGINAQPGFVQVPDVGGAPRYRGQMQ